jgi:hypothetical protein
LVGRSCPVPRKVATSGLRLRGTLRIPEVGCESLPGSGWLLAKNAAGDGVTGERDPAGRVWR